MKIRIELTYRQFIWLHEAVGQMSATEMGMTVFERLDREYRMLKEQVNDQGGQ